MHIFFKILFSALWKELFQPLIRFFLKKVGGLLLEIAKDTVKSIQLDPSLISDSIKRATAFAAIKQRMRDEGKEVSDSMVNLAIELALQSIKKRWE